MVIQSGKTTKRSVLFVKSGTDDAWISSKDYHFKAATSRCMHLEKVLKFVICNPCQSSPFLTILVPFWFILISKLLFWSFLNLRTIFFIAKTTLICRDVFPSKWLQFVYHGHVLCCQRDDQMLYCYTYMSTTWHITNKLADLWVNKVLKAFDLWLNLKLLLIRNRPNNFKLAKSKFNLTAKLSQLVRFQLLTCLFILIKIQLNQL